MSNTSETTLCHGISTTSSVSRHRHQLVCIAASTPARLYRGIDTTSSVSRHQHHLVCIAASAPACLYRGIDTSLSVSRHRHQLVCITALTPAHRLWIGVSAPTRLYLDTRAWHALSRLTCSAATLSAHQESTRRHGDMIVVSSSTSRYAGELVNMVTCWSAHHHEDMHLLASMMIYSSSSHRHSDTFTISSTC